jgi:hypothetical protein
VSIAPRGNARSAHRAPQGVVSDDTADHTAKALLWTSSEPVGLRSMPSFEGGTPVPPSEVHRATISWLWRNHIHCAPLGLDFTGLWPGSVGRPPEYRQTQIAMPQSPHARGSGQAAYAWRFADSPALVLAPHRGPNCQRSELLSDTCRRCTLHKPARRPPPVSRN